MNEKRFFEEEIIKKKEEYEQTINEIKALRELLVDSIKELNSLIEEIEPTSDILNIPKFKGQIVFEKYLEKVKNNNLIKEKTKVRGLIEKNEIIKAQKDINRLKEMIKGE